MMNEYDADKTDTVRIDDVDPTLLWVLRQAGDDWGLLGVAKAACRLAGAQAVMHPGTPPANEGDLVRLDVGDDRIIQGVLEYIEDVSDNFTGATRHDGTVNKVYLCKIFGMQFTVDEEAVHVIRRYAKIWSGDDGTKR